MKNIIFFGALLISIFFLSNCTVDQTKEIEMPDVDVSVEEGQLPSWDIKWADVNVGTTTKKVNVPKVRVIMEEEEVAVPFIDVDMPQEYGEKEELILISEAEVTGESHNLEIIEVIATGKRLNVISELKSTGQDLGDERMRVSDRIVLKAPDLDVKHYIIGERPVGDFNNQYTYLKSKVDVMDRIEGGTTIYKKDNTLSLK